MLGRHSRLADARGGLVRAAERGRLFHGDGVDRLLLKSTHLGLMGVESPTLVQVIAALGDYLRELENNEQLQAEKAARARLRVFNRQVRRQLGCA